MFQNVNGACKCREIRTIRAINYIPKILVSPQSFKIAPILANYAKFADHFLI